jgi:hypothetical protein
LRRVLDYRAMAKLHIDNRQAASEKLRAGIDTYMGLRDTTRRYPGGSAAGSIGQALELPFSIGRAEGPAKG